MFPLQLEHHQLETLPLLSTGDVKRVVGMLKTIVERRVVPDFRRRRGTEVALLSRQTQGLTIERLEDDTRSVRSVTLSVSQGEGWRLLVHERFFDLVGFVLPSEPGQRLRDGSPEELKILALTELMLRHEMEHRLYPEETEAQVIQGDIQFALHRRESDPTYYQMLTNGLADELNGLQGAPYLGLVDRVLGEHPLEQAVEEIVGAHVKALGDLRGDLLGGVFLSLGCDVQPRLLGECFQRSRSTDYSLLERAKYLRRVFRLFQALIESDEEKALRVFGSFQERWGVVELLRELELPEQRVGDSGPAALFELLKEGLQASDGLESSLPERPRMPVSVAAESSADPPRKSLKDRIEEVRRDPSIPRQVVEVILKNQVNAVGHSGAKYSELIETLLAIPWGTIRPISVSPAEFEAGLDKSHYGLYRAKELVSDFFTNLIWRCQRLAAAEAGSWQRTGSSFLFVGPPGVGKTSLAISIAESLGIPYHKLSLGGMRDESDLRGHGFTYEGSKPGAIVQGLIKMGVMNGLYILDEADKMESFAVATLLEILDPEQNHLFHDKYTQTTVDIDLSNCHFVLTANTLETVPSPVLNRCEIVALDRYSVDEKIEIAKAFLIPRVRRMYGVPEDQIALVPEERDELLAHLIRVYTFEPGVRQLERLLRTIFLRVQRKEILGGGRESVLVTRRIVKEHLEQPLRPRQIPEEDRVGEALGLGVDVERGVGSIIPVQATHIPGAGERTGGALSMLHATGNIEKVMDESRKVATTAVLHLAKRLGLEQRSAPGPIHLHFMGASTRKDGPSSGGAIALALASLLSGRKLRRDVAMTGEIDTHGRITSVGGLDVKLETACGAGCKTVVIPTENLHGPGGLDRFPASLRQEIQALTWPEWKAPHSPCDPRKHDLQVVGVDSLDQAFEIAVMDDGELARVEEGFEKDGRAVARELAAQRRNQSVVTLVIKDPSELQWDAPGARWLAGCRVLAPPGMADAEGDEGEGLPADAEPFDPGRDALLEAFSSNGADPSSVIAPFFLLRSAGLEADQFTLFANNYSLQGFKLKRCKSVLNRTWAVLARLPDDALSERPFLSTLHGIHVVDLGLIPEKYRLDPARAEELTQRFFTAWLQTVEAAS